MEWERQLWVPGASKLDHLQPFKPILFQNFSNFSSFILGGQFLLPRGLIMGKGESPNSRMEWERQLWVPRASKLDHLQPFTSILFQNFSNFSYFILGEANSYYPRGLIMGNHPTQEWNERGNFECLGHPNWTICSPLSQSCFRAQRCPPRSLEAVMVITKIVAFKHGDPIWDFPSY